MDSKLPEENNTQLPAELHKQIKNKAEIRASEAHYGEFTRGYCAGEIAGATEWAQWYVKSTAIESELHGVKAENERLNDQNNRVHEKNKLVSEEYRKLSVERNELKERCEKTEEALNNIIKWCEDSGLKDCAIDNPVQMAVYHSLHLSRNALAWKEKEEERLCPHCGKELFRDRNLCCRECGKEVERES